MCAAASKARQAGCVSTAEWTDGWWRELQLLHVSTVTVSQPATAQKKKIKSNKINKYLLKDDYILAWIAAGCLLHMGS